jgi:hypothetical protein
MFSFGPKAGELILSAMELPPFCACASENANSSAEHKRPRAVVEAITGDEERIAKDHSTRQRSPQHRKA